MTIGRWAFAVAAIAALLIMLAHAKLYFRGASAQSILQAPLDALTPQTLAERCPVVVEDVLVDPGQLGSAPLFRWQHVWRSGEEVESAQSFVTATARFTLLYYRHEDGLEGGGEGGVVLLLPPSPPRPRSKRRPRSQRGSLDEKENENEQPVAVRMVPGRVLILPPMWRYRDALGSSASGPPLRRCRLHDSVSAVFCGYVV